MTQTKGVRGNICVSFGVFGSRSMLLCEEHDTDYIGVKVKSVSCVCLTVVLKNNYDTDSMGVRV